MSESQARVVQEGHGQAGLAADAREAAAQRPPQRCEIRRAHVRQVTRLHVAPHLLDRIELRRIGRETFDREPLSLPAQVGEHATALVTAEAIPNEDEPPAVEVPFERLVEAVQPERSQSRHPLFQVVLVLQNAPEAKLDLPGIKIAEQQLPETIAKFDLTFSVNEQVSGTGEPLGLRGY